MQRIKYREQSIVSQWMLFTQAPHHQDFFQIHPYLHVRTPNVSSIEYILFFQNESIYVKTTSPGILSNT